MHEFSWWSVGRNAMGQANDMEGCSGKLADSGLKFLSRLVASDAILIGMMASPIPPTELLFKFGLRLLGERRRGEPTIGNALNESEGSDYWSVLILGSSMTKILREHRDPIILYW